MKKIFLGLLLIITLFLGLHILDILLSDLGQLTNYGYGFLTGKIFLFAVFLMAFLVTLRKIRSSKDQ